MELNMQKQTTKIAVEVLKLACEGRIDKQQPERNRILDVYIEEVYQELNRKGNRFFLDSPRRRGHIPCLVGKTFNFNKGKLQKIRYVMEQLQEKGFVTFYVDGCGKEKYKGVNLTAKGLEFAEGLYAGTRAI